MSIIRTRRWISITRLLSALLALLVPLLLVPLIIAVIYKEPLSLYRAFLVPATVSGGLALVLRFLTRNRKIHMDLPSSMIFCALSWILVSAVGSMPFMLGLGKGFTDSFFEAVSGFTTTGITVFQGLDTMPASILFWRAFIQWLGGLGILTFFLFITTNTDGEIWQLFGAEGHKISSSRPVPNVYRTIKIFWAIYGLYTLLETLILTGLGLSLFEGLLHSLTSLSTGGFSNHDASVGYYAMAGYKNAHAIEYVITLFMFLGGMNFLVHYKMLREDPRIVYRDIENKLYVQIILAFTGLTLIGMYMMGAFPQTGLEEAFRKTIFQVVSLITTTGFGTEDIGSAFFPVITKQLFIILMILGGCVGSTAGGIKVLRALILGKLLKREVNKIHLPQGAVLPTTVNGQVVKDSEVLRIAALIFGWILLIAIGAGITALFSDLGPFEAFSGMASAVGNIGPFYFSVEKMVSLSPVIKYTYIVGMLAGRLELLPLYVLLSKRVWI